MADGRVRLGAGRSRDEDAGQREDCEAQESRDPSGETAKHPHWPLISRGCGPWLCGVTGRVLTSNSVVDDMSGMACAVR